MAWRLVPSAALCASALMVGPNVLGQSPASVDFARDVLPIFTQNCVGCHGPLQQTSGLRVDRRSSVFSERRVVPRGLDNSLLYQRLIGNAYGTQMPPTGALRSEQVTLIKTWIEQGAEWPDALANEADRPPPDPKAVAMVEALRIGDRQAFMKFVDDPQLLNARDRRARRRSCMRSSIQTRHFWIAC